MQTSSVIVASLLLCIATAHAAHAQEVSVHLCEEPKESPPLRAWGDSAAKAIDRLSYAGYREVGQNFTIVRDRERSCAARANGSCAAHGKHVYCDKRQLARLTLALGINALATKLPNSQEGTGEGAISQQLSLTGSLMLADSLLNDDQAGRTRVIEYLVESFGTPIETIATTVVFLPGLHAWDVYGNDKGIQSWPEMSILHPIMEGAVNYVLAYVLGHELAHAFASCPFDEPSVVESSGLLQEVVTAQSRGAPLCPNSLLLDEYRADRCALRVVNQMDRAMSAHKERESHRLFGTFPSAVQALHSISRRLAVDALALILTTGLGAKPGESVLGRERGADGMPTIAYVMHAVPGYFYMPNRLLLLAEELSALEPYNKHLVRLCDDTAKLFVMGLNYGLTICGKQGAKDPATGASRIDQRELGASFGKYVPAGVVEGWNTGRWSDAADGSFRCDSR